MFQDSEAASRFIDGLLDQTLPHDTEADVRAQLKKDLLARLERIFAREVTAGLKPEQLTKLEALIDANEPGKIQEYLQQEGVDVQAIATRVLTEFRKAYLGE